MHGRSTAARPCRAQATWTPAKSADSAQSWTRSARRLTPSPTASSCPTTRAPTPRREELRSALETREDYLKGETLALSVSYPGEEGAPDGKEGKAGELVFSIDFTISE